MPKSRWWKISMWLLLIFLITYSYAFIAATTTDSADQTECQSAITAVTAKRHLPDSLSQPGQAAVFCELGVHFPLLRSYEATKPSTFMASNNPPNKTQSSASLRSAHEKSRQHPMLVRFIDKENWRTWSDPANNRSGGSRGPETPSRKVWIE